MPIKWVIDEEYFGDKDIHCSGCGAVIHADEWASHDWLYCYSCGGEAEKPQEPKAVKEWDMFSETERSLKKLMDVVRK